MRAALCVLCMAMCAGIASAQEPASNFEACIGESKLKHTETTMEDYSSWKCDGATAQKLASRPDQCSADIRPRNIIRTTRQLEYGFYVRVIWRTDVCAGLCETMNYEDARNASYLCEVRRHAEFRGPRTVRPTLRPTYDRRDGDEYPPGPARRWGYYGPATRSYETPARTFYRRRLDPERDARVTERWYYITPGWHLEYRYPDGDFDDRRREYRREGYEDDVRRGEYRREDYRPPRVEYFRGDYRVGDDRRDDYRQDD